MQEGYLFLIENLFPFFRRLKTIDSVEPNKKREKLTSAYRIDFDYGDILNTFLNYTVKSFLECVYWKIGIEIWPTLKDQHCY